MTHDAPLLERDRSGSTPLHLAVRKDATELVSVMLQQFTSREHQREVTGVTDAAGTSTAACTHERG